MTLYHSQKGQDRWVIEEALPGKREGCFLDLAASDGIQLSNTLVLERDFGWKGLCIEPNPFFYEKLIQNRRATCLPQCVDGQRRSVEFVLFGELGGIVAPDTDNNVVTRAQQIDHARRNRGSILMETATLHDILEMAKAPRVIDYFSFDVEGAETRILETFPFDRYTFLSLTIERPTPQLNAHLFANGYVFVRNVMFDTFYVHRSLPGFERIVLNPFEQVPAKTW
jgi:FkbM family methyltransferase